VLDPRGQLLRAAIGFAGCSLPSYERALWALRMWLDSWSGIGHAAVGMHRQGYDLQLTQYDDRGWCATFYATGIEHSPTGSIGTSWDETPCRAMQGAACRALDLADRQIVQVDGKKSLSPATRNWLRSRDYPIYGYKGGPRLYNRGLANGEGRVSSSRTLSASWSPVNGLAIKGCPATPDTA
jgi:hypothetical protein